MDLQAEIKKVEEKAAAEKASLQLHAEILAALGGVADGYETPMWHSTRLWKRAGSLHFSYCRYESIRKGRQPDAALLRELLKRIEPLPLFKFEDGCTSFRTADEVEAERNERTKQTAVGGVLVTIDPNWYSQEAKVKWVGNFDGKRIEVEVAFPMHGNASPDVGTASIRTRTDPRTGKLLEILECDFRPHDAEAKRIRWGRGSDDTLNHFTIYWQEDATPEEWIGRLGFEAA